MYKIRINLYETNMNKINANSSIIFEEMARTWKFEIMMMMYFDRRFMNFTIDLYLQLRGANNMLYITFNDYNFIAKLCKQCDFQIFQQINDGRK